ncbi:MAG TPA: tetratricopeptide repeat protein [Verrucomicrobiae bacterium]|nr:tetratricopeptide repeat protein [Verrucomicrobiae bacterium]
MHSRRLIPLLVIGAGLLAYQNSFTGPFIYDDVPSIRENRTIRHLWPIWQCLSPPHRDWLTVEGRPLINLSLAINYALDGYDVWGYHALNLAIHLLAGLTLLGIVRRTLRQPRLRDRFGGAADGVALAVAVLWTVHPLQTESVTYVVQRAESIMGLLYLLTLYCFIRGAESREAYVWYGLCVAACALGMASKEVMASAPLMVMLYDHAFLSGSIREAWRRRWPLYVALAGTWILLGVVLVSAGIFAKASTNAQGMGLNWWEYLATEPNVILHYLRLSVWPHPLCFDYYGWPVAQTWMSAVAFVVVLAVAVAASAWAWKMNSAWGFLGAWFFLILAPSSSLIPLDSPAYEHRMYLSLAAVIVLVVLGIHAVFGRHMVTVVTILTIGLGFLTWQRNRDYRSERVIWEDTVAKWPTNPRAQYNLGGTLQREGQLQRATEHYDRVLRLDPRFARAYFGRTYNNLGMISKEQKHYEQAVEYFRQALRNQPNLLEAHINLGFVLAVMGRYEESLGQFRQALQINPDSAEIHNDLGVALMKKGSIEEAIQHFSEALRVRPDFADAAHNLQAAREVQKNPARSSTAQVEVVR